MSILSSIRTVLAFFFRRRRAEREMEEELRSHVRRRADDLERSGLSRAEAERQARIEFGGYQRYKEECREAMGARLLGELFADVRYGLRQLRRNPGFTAVAVITLALGIGANTAIFSVLNALILRALPIQNPSRLVAINVARPPNQWTGMTIPQFEEIERRQTVFAGIFGRRYPNNSYVESKGTIWRINLGYVTGKYYSVLGVRPVIGRLIEPADVGLSVGAPTPVAVLSYEFWQRRYRGNPNVIGRTIVVGGAPFAVIGVTPRGFFGDQVGFSLDVTIPITEIPGRAGIPEHGQWVQYAIGRLRDGVNLGEARAQLNTVWPAIRATTVPLNAGSQQRARSRALQLQVLKFPESGFSYLRQRFAEPLYVLVAIAALILLIACVNLASMLFARGSAREHEMAIRVALGARRWRLTRQLLTESLLLSIGGASLGSAFAFRGSALLVAFWKQIPFNPITVLNVSPNLHVLGFTIVATVAAAVLFGLGPALYASHRPPAAAIQAARRGPGRRFRRLGNLLIMAQVALSVVLVTTGGLLVHSFEKLRTFDPGFQYRHVAFLQLEPLVGGGKISDEPYCRALLSRLSALPTVQSVALAQMLPGFGFGGYQRVAAGTGLSYEGVDANGQIVSPDYFRTLSIPLLHGRNFSPHDNGRSQRVAIISQSLARRLFPSGDAIGNQIRLVPLLPNQQKLTVVGIVGDARIPNLQRPWPYIVYGSYFQWPARTRSWTNVLLRVTYASPEMFQAAAAKVQSLGREYVLMSGSGRQLIDAGLAGQRAMAYVAAFFLALALLLAAVGLYGLMAYTVVQRTREIGIRMALGATRTKVLAMVLGDAFWVVFGGLAVGLPCAIASARLLEHMLFDISPYDPSTLAIVVSSLITAAMVACWIPARRAANVDPMVALRHE